MDWGSVTDLCTGKFRTPDDLKRVVVAAAMRSNLDRMEFVEREQAWHAAMKGYRSQRETILFPGNANVDDFKFMVNEYHSVSRMHLQFDSYFSDDLIHSIITS
jgi:hypothetical protein